MSDRDDVMASLAIESPRRTYTVLIGAVVALLAVGLAITYSFGEPVTGPPDRLDSGEVATQGFNTGDGSSGDPGSVDGAASIETPTSAGPGAVPGQGSGAVAPVAGSAGDAGGQLAASDVGVTKDTIRVGIVLLSLGALGDIGFNIPAVSEEGQKQEWNAFIDDVNARGGVLGRKVVPYYATVTLTDTDSRVAACVYFTEDVKVFAVFNRGVFYGPDSLCVTEAHQTPMVTSFGYTDEIYARSKGLVVTLEPALFRQLRNMVWGFDRLGLLKGKKIGIFTYEAAREEVEKAMIPALKEFGHQVTYVVMTGNDPSAAPTEISLGVQQMRARGVDTVLVAVNGVAVAIFQQEAESQRYYPRYLVSDHSGATSAFSASNYTENSEVVGLTAFKYGEGAAKLPEDPEDASCRKVFEKASGGPVDRAADEQVYAQLVTACTTVRLFTAAAARVGPDLTRTGWAAQFHRLGPVKIGFSAGGSYSPTKLNGMDFIRTLRFDYPCKCWKLAGGFERTRF